MNRDREPDGNMVQFPRLSDGEKRELEALIRETGAESDSVEDLRRRVLGLEVDLGRLARLVLRLDEEVAVLSRLERLSSQRDRLVKRLRRK
jgi:hypothetical protein